jgi:hypothetical protein
MNCSRMLSSMIFFFYKIFIAIMNPVSFYRTRWTLPNLPSPSFAIKWKLSLVHFGVKPVFYLNACLGFDLKKVGEELELGETRRIDEWSIDVVALVYLV